MEVLSEGLVFDVVPADSRAEAQSADGEQIDVGRLTGHECRLPLGQGQNPGGEAGSLGDRGEAGEHDQWVMERIVFGMGAGVRGCSIGVDGAEHVIVGGQVVEAEVLDRPPAPRLPRSLIWG